MNTRKLLSFTNGTPTVERITTDPDGNAICPNDFPHGPHSNAVWTDWDEAEVYNCPGEAFGQDN